MPFKGTGIKINGREYFWNHQELSHGQSKSLKNFLKEIQRKMQEPGLAPKEKEEFLSNLTKTYEFYIKMGQDPTVPPRRKPDTVPERRDTEEPNTEESPSLLGASRELGTLGEHLSRGLERLRSFIKE